MHTGNRAWQLCFYVKRLTSVYYSLVGIGKILASVGLSALQLETPWVKIWLVGKFETRTWNPTN